MDDILTKLTDVLPAKYKTTILLLLGASPYISRSIYALRQGKGLKGLLSSIWLGTNTPSAAQLADQAVKETIKESETNAK